MNTFFFLAEAGVPPFNLGVSGSIFILIGIIAIHFWIGSGKEHVRDNFMLTNGLTALIFGLLLLISALIHGAKNEILEEISKTRIHTERPITPKQN